jgi:hypothetical protein
LGLIPPSFACALYVGVAAYGTPQEWLGTAMLFGVAIGFNACFGVACVWGHIELVFISTT